MSFMARCPERNSCTKRCRRVQVAIRKTGSPECKPLSAWQLRRLQLASQLYYDLLLYYICLKNCLMLPKTHITKDLLCFFMVFLAFCFTFIFLDADILAFSSASIEFGSVAFINKWRMILILPFLHFIFCQFFSFLNGSFDFLVQDSMSLSFL